MHERDFYLDFIWSSGSHTSTLVFADGKNRMSNFFSKSSQVVTEFEGSTCNHFFTFPWSGKGKSEPHVICRDSNENKSVTDL